MNKEKLLKSLPLLGVLAVVLILGGIAYTHAQSIGSYLSPKVYVAGNYIEAQGSSQGVSLGASGGPQTAALHVTNSTNWDTGFFWGDLEVAGNTYLDGSLTASSSTFTSVSSTNGTFTSVTTTNLKVTNCTGCGGGPSTYQMWYGLTAGTGNSSTSDYPATVAVKTSVGTGRVPFPRLGPGSLDIPT